MIDYARTSIDDPEDELYSRKLARQSFLDMVTYTYPTYKVDIGHQVIADTLVKVLNNEIDRLMIFAPPQHGKSELVSIRFPAYWLAKRPEDPIILCSYGSSLAFDKVYNTRQLIEGLAYKALFPDIAISPTTKGGTNWRIKGHRAVYISAGVGGPITGHGGMLGIIDDPFKNWQEAESWLIRERVWQWYRSTFRTRIWEGGKIIIVMTRWHEDDLAGRLLNDQSERWQVLRLPAIAETQDVRNSYADYLKIPQFKGQPDPAGRNAGEPLCPSRFNIDTLLELKADVGPLAWTAEYQGSPRAPEGNIIKRSWFDIIDALPKDEYIFVRYWDNAATQDGGARTAGVLMAQSKTSKEIYIPNITIGQWSTANRRRIQREVAEADREAYGHVTIVFELEGGSGGIDTYKDTVEYLSGFTVMKDRPTGEKLTRLGPFMGKAEIGRVHLIKGTWNNAYLDELTAVPANAYWDQVDGTSGAYKFLTRSGWARGAAS